MDIDFLYASEMELLFSYKGFPLGISDFHLRGTVRVVLKPLLCKIPIIGGLQIYCLEAPEIDYKLRGMAGALDFFHIGGLSQLIKDAINEQVITKLHGICLAMESQPGCAVQCALPAPASLYLYFWNLAV